MGDWRSWLARLTGSQKVTGSNPVFSTKSKSSSTEELFLYHNFFSNIKKRILKIQHAFVF